MKEPYLIQGGIFSDERGTLNYVNDFSLQKIQRFYTITQSPESGPRAWQGHKTEAKYFYCLKGSFAIRLVKIINWENPENNPEIKSFTLSEFQSIIISIKKMIYIPFLSKMHSLIIRECSKNLLNSVILLFTWLP